MIKSTSIKIYKLLEGINLKSFPELCACVSGTLFSAFIQRRGKLLKYCTFVHTHT